MAHRESVADHLLRARGRLKVILSLLDDAQAFNRDQKRPGESYLKQAENSAFWLLRDLVAASLAGKED